MEYTNKERELFNYLETRFEMTAADRSWIAQMFIDNRRELEVNKNLVKPDVSGNEALRVALPIDEAILEKYKDLEIVVLNKGKEVYRQ